MEYFSQFPRFGGSTDLEPMRRLMAALGDPHKRLRYVHIAGTNGKGSITAMTASVLRQAGYRVGMYTSPYILRFAERMQVNGEPISDAALADAVAALEPAVRTLTAEGVAFAQFDVVTAAAFWFFAQQRCDVVCLEVGLGGRLDATNVIDADCCAAVVIGAIGLDHTQILGDTVEQIAREKCGIIKRCADVVCYPLQPDGALEEILRATAEQNARLHMPAVGGLRDTTTDPLHPSFTFGEQAYTLRLLGRHQLYNAMTAIETARVLRGKGFALTDAHIRDGLAAATLPVRLQKVADRPVVLLDGAHNPHGAAALADFLSDLRGAGYRVALVLGMLADKDAAGAVGRLTAACDAAAAVPVDNPRALTAEELYPLLQCAQKARFSDVLEAVAWAREQAGPAGAVVVAGSLYLAAEALRRLGENAISQ